MRTPRTGRTGTGRRCLSRSSPAGAWSRRCLGRPRSSRPRGARRGVRPRPGRARSRRSRRARSRWVTCASRARTWTSSPGSPRAATCRRWWSRTRRSRAATPGSGRWARSRTRPCAGRRARGVRAGSSPPRSAVRRAAGAAPWPRRPVWQMRINDAFDLHFALYVREQGDGRPTGTTAHGDEGHSRSGGRTWHRTRARQGAEIGGVTDGLVAFAWRGFTERRPRHLRDDCGLPARRRCRGRCASSGSSRPTARMGGAHVGAVLDLRRHPHRLPCVEAGSGQRPAGASRSDVDRKGDGHLLPGCHVLVRGDSRSTVASSSRPRRVRPSARRAAQRGPGRCPDPRGSVRRISCGACACTTTTHRRAPASAAAPGRRAWAGSSRREAWLPPATNYTRGSRSTCP